MRRLPIILFLLCPLLSFGQKDSSGVYMTLQDYQLKRLSFAINCETEKHKIKSSQFNHKDFVRVIHNDSLFTLPKAQIFGYLDCKATTYRIVDGKNYSILNPYEALVLYKHQIGGHKRRQVHYFFAKTIDMAPVRLSLENLAKEFQDQPAFLQQVTKTFKRDSQLLRFNKKVRKFELSLIYSNTYKN
jgi:hypothetical protein